MSLSRVLVALLLAFSLVSDDDAWIASQPTFQALAPEAVTQELERLWERFPDFQARLETSPYFQALPGPASLELVLNRKRDGTRLLEVPLEKRVRLRYLPLIQMTQAVLQALPDRVQGIAFLHTRTAPDGIAIGHEGLVLDRRWLVHADSVRKRTSRLDLLSYLLERADPFDGVIFYRIR